jgi:hypothetical protein
VSDNEIGSKPDHVGTDLTENSTVGGGLDESSAVEVGKPHNDERLASPEAGEVDDGTSKAAPQPSDTAEQTATDTAKTDFVGASEIEPEIVASRADFDSVDHLSEADASEEHIAEETSPEEPAFVEPKAEAGVDDAPKEEPKAPAPPVIDPFSVDEIEAEFARLLGRAVDKDPKRP